MAAVANGSSLPCSSIASAVNFSPTPATLVPLGAGMGDEPSLVRAADFGSILPTLPHAEDLSEHSLRIRVLIECLLALEAGSASATYHTAAVKNVAAWASQRADRLEGSSDAGPGSGVCHVRVLPGDWGEVTASLTKEYGQCFAALNMANAYSPGGGYTHGMVAQEENMFRRTDAHFSIVRERDLTPDGDYTRQMTNLLNASPGRCYLDVQRPRVCIRGAEDRESVDLGYPWLSKDEVFPFYELRAAAVDLRDPRLQYDHQETIRRAGAILDTLIFSGVRHVVLSAFGCGAFRNPAAYVAQAFMTALKQAPVPLSEEESAVLLAPTRAQCMDVVAFAIFNAGYGPDNFEPFLKAFESWDTEHGIVTNEYGTDASGGRRGGAADGAAAEPSELPTWPLAGRDHPVVDSPTPTVVVALFPDTGLPPKRILINPDSTIADLKVLIEYTLTVAAVPPYPYVLASAVPPFNPVGGDSASSLDSTSIEAAGLVNSAVKVARLEDPEGGGGGDE